MNKNRKKRYEKIMDTSGRIFLFPLLLTGYILKLYDKLFKSKKEKDLGAQHKNLSDF
ncbi:MAG: hypothetical protein ACRCU6_04660 [Fusobacteriaceae bacterium]